MRELESDLSFMRTYLTRDVVEELDLYIYAYDDGGVEGGGQELGERARPDRAQPHQLRHRPTSPSRTATIKRNRELYLKHHFDGDELDQRYAEKTLRYVQQLWGRTVHVETVVDDKPVLFSYDGTRNARATL